ncbi:hypothetical protein D3981_004206 [Escherichia coli]|nr:hypothetical protein [Escherichia coli]
MELGIMVCIVLLLSLGASWISNWTIELLEKFYFRRQLSMEYGAWLRVACAVLLYVFTLLMPHIGMLYTMKLVALVNIAIQIMKLNGVYKLKRAGGQYQTSSLALRIRDNFFRKK